MTTSQPERTEGTASPQERAEAAAQPQPTADTPVQLQRLPDVSFEGKEDLFLDIDRMVNEGLGGGRVTLANGLIEDSGADTIDDPESVQES